MKRILYIHGKNPKPPAALHAQLPRRWVNIAARGDLVALEASLPDDFGDMLAQQSIEKIDDHNKGIYTLYRDNKGLNVHKSYGYLVNPVVAGEIADWWRAA